MKLNSPRLLGLVLALAACAGCAHSYSYRPEIAGPGVIQDERGGIVYSLPPTGQADFTIRVRSLGVRKTHDVHMLALRMSITRAPGAPMNVKGAQEFIDPSDLLVKIGDDRKIKPAFLHSKARNQSVIDLSGVKHEVIDLLYPLPPSIQGPGNFVAFQFQWKLHYGRGKSDQRNALFDRFDSVSQQGAELYPEDSDYPYDLSPMPMPGWQISRDPYWWAYDPWWPWG